LEDQRVLTTYTVGDSRIDDHFSEWSFFLMLHDIDIGDVFRLDVSRKNMTVWRYKKNENGVFYRMEDAEVAKETLTMEMKVKPPNYV
jgi:hypothetical protein